ncbi:MAG TPA: Ig-like domain-containing protein [bacterium]|nr:Ig-like domain-containing protein [bacterium]
MRNVFKAFFLAVLGSGILLAAACGSGSGGDDGANFLPAAPADHAFMNAAAAPGNAPADLDASGPVVSGVQLSSSGRSIVIQGQALIITVNFTAPDGDVTAPSLLIEVLGQDEYWTFDFSQFGAVLGGVAMVRVEVSGNFEPGAYDIRVGLRDDAGHVGNLFERVFIVTPAFTPDVVIFTPEDGAADVPLNSALRAVFSDPMAGDTPSLTLTAGGQPVPGFIRVLPNLRGITLIPDDFLEPASECVATLTLGTPTTGGVKTEVHTFTTGALDPVPDPSGRVYSMALGATNVVEPPGAEMLFTVIPFPRHLIRINNLDEPGNAIEAVGALALEGPLRQSPDLSNMIFPVPDSNLRNPYFAIGPSLLNVDLNALTGGLINVAINIRDVRISGEFTAGGDQFEHGIETGYIDSQELNQAIQNFTGLSFNVCFTLPDACDADGRLSFRAEELVGYYELSISDLYDLSIAANPGSVPQATGGAAAISGEYLVNGIPSGTHTISLSTTHGTLSGGGTCAGTASCAVDTVGGAYSVVLTVPGGLPAGTQVTISASSPSYIGDLNRSAKVLAQ